MTTSRTAASGRTHPTARRTRAANPFTLSVNFKLDTFSRLLFLALALCLALYAEEVAHFLRYGWNGPDNDISTRSLADCRPVPGSVTDFECPVRGYGMARYRDMDPSDSSHRHLAFIDRIQ